MRWIVCILACLSLALPAHAAIDVWTFADATDGLSANDGRASVKLSGAVTGAAFDYIFATEPASAFLTKSGDPFTGVAVGDYLFISWDTGAPKAGLYKVVTYTDASNMAVEYVIGDEVNDNYTDASISATSGPENTVANAIASGIAATTSNEVMVKLTPEAHVSAGLTVNSTGDTDTVTLDTLGEGLAVFDRSGTSGDCISMGTANLILQDIDVRNSGGGTDIIDGGRSNSGGNLTIESATLTPSDSVTRCIHWYPDAVTDTADLVISGGTIGIADYDLAWALDANGSSAGAFRSPTQTVTITGGTFYCDSNGSSAEAGIRLQDMGDAAISGATVTAVNQCIMLNGLLNKVSITDSTLNLIDEDTTNPSASMYCLGMGTGFTGAETIYVVGNRLNATHTDATGNKGGLYFQSNGATRNARGYILNNVVTVDVSGSPASYGIALGGEGEQVAAGSREFQGWVISGNTVTFADDASHGIALLEGTYGCLIQNNESYNGDYGSLIDKGEGNTWIGNMATATNCCMLIKGAKGCKFYGNSLYGNGDEETIQFTYNNNNQSSTHDGSATDFFFHGGTYTDSTKTITTGAAAFTNYRLSPGDQIYITAPAGNAGIYDICTNADTSTITLCQSAGADAIGTLEAHEYVYSRGYEIIGNIIDASGGATLAIGFAGPSKDSVTQFTGGICDWNVYVSGSAGIANFGTDESAPDYTTLATLQAAWTTYLSDPDALAWQAGNDANSIVLTASPFVDPENGVFTLTPVARREIGKMTNRTNAPANIGSTPSTRTRFILIP